MIDDINRQQQTNVSYLHLQVDDIYVWSVTSINLGLVSD